MAGQIGDVATGCGVAASCIVQAETRTKQRVTIRQQKMRELIAHWGAVAHVPGAEMKMAMLSEQNAQTTVLTTNRRLRRIYQRCTCLRPMR